MATDSSLRQRQNTASLTNGSSVKTESTASEAHPLGKPKHGIAMQYLRIGVFAIWFLVTCCFIHGSQLLGLPLYLVSRDWYRAWIAVTKGYFGVLATFTTRLFAPTPVRISGDKSVAGLLTQSKDGQVRLHFGERVILIANHQLYTDWLYLWWASYTNDPGMHGYIYIILKASLKWTPMIGPAMQLYDFIFMKRSWAGDQVNMIRHLSILNKRGSAPLTESGPRQLDPMWLLIFPEGTNLTQNERNKSAEFSKQKGWPDFKHILVPRIKGFQLCLQQLQESVEYVYDCTIAYGGVPEGGYGSQVFTLRSVYFQGRPPKSVNMHWRRYKIADLPLDDQSAMFDWIMARWREKDEIMDIFQRTGKFPGDVSAVNIEGGPQDEFKTPHMSTEVQSRSVLEFFQIFVPVTAAALLLRSVVQVIDKFAGTAPLFG